MRTERWGGKRGGLVDLTEEGLATASCHSPTPSRAPACVVGPSVLAGMGLCCPRADKVPHVGRTVRILRGLRLHSQDHVPRRRLLLAALLPRHWPDPVARLPLGRHLQRSAPPWPRLGEGLLRGVLSHTCGFLLFRWRATLHDCVVRCGPCLTRRLIPGRREGSGRVRRGDARRRVGHHPQLALQLRAEHGQWRCAACHVPLLYYRRPTSSCPVIATCGRQYAAH